MQLIAKLEAQLQLIACWSSAIVINWKPRDAITINSKTAAINCNDIACITGYVCVVFYLYIVNKTVEGGVFFWLRIRKLINPHTTTRGGPSPNKVEIWNEGSEKKISGPTQSGWGGFFEMPGYGGWVLWKYTKGILEMWQTEIQILEEELSYG